ncbi:DUF4397 domain-containing protein [Saccharospirillum impatiens]|uniref:DUF4397 domain-containing protein n=1 Tax=Saccharospirillum impatiens TaxID=169438 RepID=UPI00041B4B43|nr:DUF4397 domain-containing protein [Saccharospirillum impatiens]
MHTLKVIAGIAISGLILAGCESNSDDDDTTAKASLRVLHASENSPAVNVYLNDAMSPAVDTLGYGSASALAEVDAGTYATDVFGILPGGADTADAVIDTELTLEADVTYTVVAVNPLASISAKVFSDDGSEQDSSKVRVQVAHLAPDAPAVDVHVTAPGATLTANTVLGTLEFTSGSDLLGPTLVDEGSYQIRVTAQGSLDPVYDSGSLELTAGSDLFIGAIPNMSGVGESPIALSVSDDSTSSIIFDANTAAVRAVHNASDVGEVDIFAAADDDSDTLDVTDFSNGNALFADVTYPAISAYAEVGPGDYDVAVSANNTDAAISAEGVTLSSGTSYTVFAMGTAASDDTDLELVPYVDDRRSIATAAKIRIIHGSAATADVDLYATAGTDITNEDPAFADVAYKASTGFIELAAGTYNFTVTPANSKTIAVQAELVLEAGDIVTVWARDAGAAVELSVQDDSPAAP